MKKKPDFDGQVLSKVSTLECIGDWDTPQSKILVSPGFFDEWPIAFEQYLKDRCIAGLKVARDDKYMAENAHQIEQAAKDLTVASEVLKKTNFFLPQWAISFSMGGDLMSTVEQSQFLARVWISTVVDSQKSWDKSNKAMIRMKLIESGHDTNREYLGLRASVLQQASVIIPELSILEQADKKKQREGVMSYAARNGPVELVDNISMSHADFTPKVASGINEFIPRVSSIIL